MRLSRPSSAAALMVLAALSHATPAHGQMSRLAVSLDSLVARAERDSLDPVAQYELGIGYWASQRYDDAEHALRRSVAIEPKTAAGYLALSFLPYARRPKLWFEEDRGRIPAELKEAVAESDRLYRRAFMIDPMVDLQIYGLMLPPLPGGRYDRVTQSLLQGFGGFFGGQYLAAFDGFDAVLNSIPARDRTAKAAGTLLWYHGLAAAHIERYGTAAQDVRILLDWVMAREKTDSIAPFATLRSNEFRYVLAALEQEAGQRDSALAHFQEVLTTDLGQYMAHVRMAAIYSFRQQWDLAIEERRRAIATNPDDSSLLYDLGFTLAQAQRLTEARDVLVRAMAMNPLNARIPYVLGRVQVALHDPSARGTLERFVAMAPSTFADQVAEARTSLASLP
jgi:tetratricopeptide (TPR) repeat protein